MRVGFEASGGFANLRLRYEADTETLDEDVARTLEKEVRRSGLLESEEGAIGSSKPGPPDVLTYRVTVTHDGTTRTWTMTDVTVPSSARPLLAALRALAMKKPPRQ